MAERASLYRKRHPGRHEENMRKYTNKPYVKVQQYKSNAKRRGLQFLLTRDEFMAFWKKACYYCGADMKTVGLDRVDPKIGYLKENLVSCCRLCNRAKSDLSQAAFLELCRLVAARHA